MCGNFGTRTTNNGRIDDDEDGVNFSEPDAKVFAFSCAGKVTAGTSYTTMWERADRAREEGLCGRGNH